MRVSATLVMFSLGLLGNGLSLLLTRAFFGLQEPRIPTLVALVNLVLNLFFDLALLRYGAAGIALATAIVTSFNAGVLMVLLRRRVGSLHGREVLHSTALTAVATIYCTVAAFGVWYPMDKILGRSIAGQIVSLGLGLAAEGFTNVGVSDVACAAGKAADRTREVAGRVADNLGVTGSADGSARTETAAGMPEAVGV